ncbi:MAG TPA: hypothetical protein VHC63_01200 [Acidimicrobiales bacterium]|nr:hypothetical protein [Acidimicrobiales bacterium]
MALDLDRYPSLRQAVERARAAAEKDGSLHPLPGKHIETTPAFREAFAKIVADGTFAEAVATIAEHDPDLA